MIGMEKKLKKKLKKVKMVSIKKDFLLKLIK